MLEKAFFFRSSSSAFFRASSSSLRARSSCQGQKRLRSRQTDTSPTGLRATHSLCPHVPHSRACATQEQQHEPPTPRPWRETHGQAGLALLLPLAADPLLLCPLRSPLLLPEERTLAWARQEISVLSVPTDTSPTPKAPRAPRADLLLPGLPWERVDQ